MRTTRTLLVLATLGVAAWIGLEHLADATQTRPDSVHPDTTTEIVFSVDTNRFEQGSGVAALALWTTCSGTVTNQLLDPGVQPLGDDAYRVVVRPALGRYGRERVLGCLRDATVDRVQGRVVSVTDGAP